MGVSYKTIGWNPHKKIYDQLMLAIMVLYLLVFAISNILLHPTITPETLIIRASGSLALIMLHVILVIGPLCRLNDRFLPLLYNRRHLGVSMFLIAAIHGIFSIIQFHTLGNINAFSSIFLSNLHYGSAIRFPFQTLGFFALIILFLMAATSHDFWLNQLSPMVWKTLHMLVYVAYGLIIMHVMLGVVQLESSPLLVASLGIGLIGIISLHILAGRKQLQKDQESFTNETEGFYEVCKIAEIPDRRAKIVIINGENIAIFKYNNKLSAVNNVCKHQNGPLGEGKIVDSCIVCPWHGYEYQPDDGCSPPPFTERLSTYDLKIAGDSVWVNPNPHPEGTRVEPVIF